jgi:Flp pilus assembly protein TadG
LPHTLVSFTLPSDARGARANVESDEELQVRGRKRRPDGDRGAALVEFALILPVFMMLVLGMFSGGLAYNQKLGITHATREGARYGATVPVNQTFSDGRTWAQGVRDLVVERSAGDLTADQVVCVALVTGPRFDPQVVADSPAGNSHLWRPASLPAPCPFKEHASDPTDPGPRVQVAARRPGRIELLVSSIDVTLRAQANAQYEGATTP